MEFAENLIVMTMETALPELIPTVRQDSVLIVPLRIVPLPVLQLMRPLTVPLFSLTV